MRGDCLTCSLIGTCSRTSVQKVLDSFTCALYEPVPAPVYHSRVMMMQTYGDEVAVQAMMNDQQHQKEEEK
jgi:hypothetical protein